MARNPTKFPRLSDNQKDKTVTHPPLEPTSFERVLSTNRFILIHIFHYCASGDDLKTLLNVRQVCYSWWEQSRKILWKNSHLIPEIRGYNKNTINNTLAKFRRNVTPDWELPVNIYVRSNCWTRNVSTFLSDYSANITSWTLEVLEPLPRHAVQTELHFPLMKHTKLETLIDDPLRLRRFYVRNEVAFWRNTLSRSKFIKTCKLCYFGSGLERLDLQIPQNPNDYLVPPNLTSLDCDIVLLNRIAGNPRLVELKLKLAEGINTSEAFEERESTLKSLSLSSRLFDIDNVDRIMQVGVMTNLETLKLGGNTIVQGRNGQSLQALLPNLMDVTGTGSILFRLTEGNWILEGVRKLSITDDSMFTTWNQAGHVYTQRMQRFATSFPNLRKLHWSVKDPVENITEALRFVFAHLSQLTELKIEFFLVSLGLGSWKLVDLLTGVSQGRIPRARTTWSNAVVGRNTAITNLQNLEKLNIIDACRINFITKFHKQFLCRAAFAQMPNLRHHTIEGITERPSLNDC